MHFPAHESAEFKVFPSARRSSGKVRVPAGGVSFLRWAAPILSRNQCEAPLHWARHARQATVGVEVSLRHSFDCEALLELEPNRPAIQRTNVAKRCDRLGDRAHDKARDAIVDDLRNGTAFKRDDRRPASHSLDHHKPKRFWPSNRKQERLRVSKKFRLFPLINLADELNIRMGGDHRCNDLLPVPFVHCVDLRSNLQRKASSCRNFNCPIGTFLGRDAAEKCEISRLWAILK